ncbi:unnamed protein product [Brachionus calyciflorus]|uniref:PX domain-containing protein n=1 Tax=Brachionus calyciflorus TaxID=104777 RepID=A0A814JPG5_9BILA|nr:unnamed protein product [Brachionus calyciflorus]
MSTTPPPDTEEAPSTEIDLNTQIDLGQNTTEEKSENDQTAPSDDMFFSTMSDPEPKTKQTEDMDEIFQLNKPMANVNLNEPEVDEDDDDPFSFSNKTPQPKPVVSTEINIQPVLSDPRPVPPKLEPKIETEPVKPALSTFAHNIEDEDDEEKGKYLEITLSEPHKIGDGMGSYMVYKITIKTNIPSFKSKEFTTNRRFSDFLTLFEKLKEKHLPAGRILPPAPEKDMIGMAKVKMSKDTETSPVDFLEKRRAALQRFLERLAAHKTFRYDPDFRDFLEISDELPKTSNMSALSGAGMLKMFKSVTESVSKITVKMEETDQWFDEKSRQIDNLYVQYKKLHSVAELLYGWRKDLAASTKEFSKTTAILANSEEQLSLSRALSHLGEAYEKIDQIYVEQANADYFKFAELIKDYVCLFDNIKEVFFQRIKTFGNWQRAEDTLKLKKENKAKLEATNKLDKIPAVLAEINEWEAKVAKSKEDFEQISKTIKEEIKRFDLNRAIEFKTQLTNYLETMLQNQESIVKVWEQYYPEVKAI